MGVRSWGGFRSFCVRSSTFAPVELISNRIDVALAVTWGGRCERKDKTFAGLAQIYVVESIEEISIHSNMPSFLCQSCRHEKDRQGTATCSGRRSHLLRT